jgi:hypothetical protein
MTSRTAALSMACRTTASSCTAASYLHSIADRSDLPVHALSNCWCWRQYPRRRRAHWNDMQLRCSCFVHELHVLSVPQHPVLIPARGINLTLTGVLPAEHPHIIKHTLDPEPSPRASPALRLRVCAF